MIVAPDSPETARSFVRQAAECEDDISTMRAFVSHRRFEGVRRRPADYMFAWESWLVVPEAWGRESWLRRALESGCRLLELPPNWDSYGAAAITPQSVVSALNLLIRLMDDDTPEPQIVPTPSGGVQMEWHTRGIDLEIETLGGGRFGAFFEDARTGATWEGDVEVADSRLSDAIRALAERR
jgi:hypothetical protein